MCPKCQSLERHRLVFLYLRGIPLLQGSPGHVLHVAPEQGLRSVFDKLSSINYITTDLLDLKVDIRMDICQNLFRDNTFDLIVCNHVLEHVPNDRQAMKEFLRVLKPGGIAILQVPINLTLNGLTYEDPSIVDPEHRLRAFGQRDHVRIYGRDYKQRLIDSGFAVETFEYSTLVPVGLAQRYALDLNETLYICHKGGSA